jgi:integrase
MLHRIFAMAIKGRKITENPCCEVKRLAGEQPRTRYLLPEKETRLLDACNEPLRSLVLLALGTGMRRGELFKLKWTNVDFLAQEIKVIQTKTSRDRFVPMSDTVRETLVRLRLETNGEFVFPSRTDVMVRSTVRLPSMLFVVELVLWALDSMICGTLLLVGV